MKMILGKYKWLSLLFIPILILGIFAIINYSANKYFISPLDYQLISNQQNPYFYLDETGEYIFVFDQNSAKLFSLKNRSPILIKTLSIHGLTNYPHTITNAQGTVVYFDNYSEIFKMDPKDFVKYSLESINCKDTIPVKINSTVIITKDTRGLYGDELLIINVNPDFTNRYTRYGCVDSYTKYTDYEKRKDITTQIWAEDGDYLNLDALSREHEKISIDSKGTFCFSDWCPQKVSITLFGHGINFTNTDPGGLQKIAMSNKIIDSDGCIPITFPELRIDHNNLSKGLYLVCSKRSVQKENTTK